MSEPLPEPLPEAAPDETAEALRVRLRTPAQILGAVPHLVGFHPEHSLVVLALHGDRSRIGLTLRYDLPPPEYDDRLAADVALRVAHDGAGSALVVCYPSLAATEVGVDADARSPEAVLPRRSLAAAVRAALTDEGVSLTDAFCVMGGRFWSYICSNERCCPPEGRPLAEPDGAVNALAAAQALSGRVVLPDRDALVASVAPDPAYDTPERCAALDRVLEEAADLVLDGRRRDLRQRALAVFEALVTRFAREPGAADVTADELAWAVAGFYDVHVRDAVLAAAAAVPVSRSPWELDDPDSGADLTTYLSLFTVLARRCYPPDDAPVCTALAFAAYGLGDGALAWAALDRALETEPDYSLAQLLAEGLQRQVAPGDLRRTWARAGAEVARLIAED